MAKTPKPTNRPQEPQDRPTPKPAPSSTATNWLDPAGSLNTNMPAEQYTALVENSLKATAEEQAAKTSSQNATSTGSSVEMNVNWAGQNVKLGVRLDPNTGGRTLMLFQMIKDPNTNQDIPYTIGNAFLVYDKKGQPKVTSLNDKISTMITSMTPEDFQWYKSKFLASGLMNNRSANADKNNPDFVAALAMSLTGMSLNNFDQKSAGSKEWFGDPKKFLQSKYGDTPEVIDSRQVALANIKRIASSNGVVLSQNELNKKANLIALGLASQDAINIEIGKQAKAFYPQFEKELNQGLTVRQIIEPWIATTQNILEIDDDIDLSDPKSPIRKALDYRDKSGNKTLMPLYDYEITLKKDPMWMKTKNAANTFANLYSTLKEGFGLG
jgi:hypothetical protein